MKTIRGPLVFVTEAFSIVVNNYLIGIRANPDLLSRNLTLASSNTSTVSLDMLFRGVIHRIQSEKFIWKP
jgi:hypothetical protein